MNEDKLREGVKLLKAKDKLTNKSEKLKHVTEVNIKNVDIEVYVEVEDTQEIFIIYTNDLKKLILQQVVDNNTKKLAEINKQIKELR